MATATQATTLERSQPPSDSQIVARNSVVMVTRFGALWVLNALLALFLPRYLGADGLGTLYFAMSFASLFTMGVALGTRQFLIKEVARDRSQMARFLGASVTLKLGAAATVLGAIMLTAYITGDYERTGTVLFLAALWMIAINFSKLMSGFLYGEENVTWPAIAELANKIVVVAAGITVLLMGMGVVAYAAVLLAGAMVDFLVNSANVLRRVPLRLSLDRSKMKTMLVGGAPFLIMGFITTAYSHVDVVMLRYYTQEAVVGWYAAAHQLYRAIEFVPVALTTALLPTLARVHVANVPAMAGIARKAIVAGVLLITPIALGVAMAADKVIGFLPYPDSFENSVPLLMLLALSIPVTALLTILGTIAIAVDRQRAWAVALAMTVALNIGLNAGLIPYFQEAHGNGGIGAASATLISEGFMVGIGLWLIPRSILNREIFGLFGKTALAGLFMVTPVLIGRQVGMDPIPMVALGLAVYGATVLATRAVTMQDLRFLLDSAGSRVKGFGAGKGKNAREGT